MVWSIVDALRADDVVFAETEEGHASSVNGHSRNTSYTSSRRDSTPAPGEADTVRNGWNGIAGGTQTLNLRHRDRSSVSPARPQTDVSGCGLVGRIQLTVAFTGILHILSRRGRPHRPPIQRSRRIAGTNRYPSDSS